MRQFHRLSIISIVSLLLIIAVVVQAQANCPALVQQAIAAMGENCGGLDRNMACYGFNLVDASFTEAIAEDFFTSPSDETELASLQTIQTAPYNLDLSQWGIAAMSVQANVPGTLPGQSVTFILVGDAQVENQVASEDVTAQVTPITVTANAYANVRSGPGTNYNVIGAVENGTTLQADALSEDGQWARVAFENRPAWVAFLVIDSPEGLADLPSALEPVLSPMQSFYFSGGIGQAVCNEAPDLLTIRSPQGIHINLTVNGANIVVGSQITLQQLSETEMSLTTDEGQVFAIDPDANPSPQQIQEFMQMLDSGEQPDINGDEFTAMDGAIEGFVAPGGKSLIGQIGEDNEITNWEQPDDSDEDQQTTGDLSTLLQDALGGDKGEEVVFTPTPTQPTTSGGGTGVNPTPIPTAEATEVTQPINPNIITNPQTQPSGGTTVPTGPTFIAYWAGCTGLYSGALGFANTPPGTTSVTITWSESGGAATPGAPTNVTVPPDPGVFNYITFGPSTLFSAVVTANPSGTSYSVAGSQSC